MIYNPSSITVRPVLNMEFGRVSAPPEGYSEPNCYGYALHVPIWMQPGSHGPVDLYNESETSPEGLLRALEADGLTRTDRRAFDPAREHVIAAFFSPSAGYHILRLDGDGTWSHQDGSASPRRTDAAGKLILDPQTADMGTYRFVSYFCIQSYALNMRIRYDGPQW